MGGGKRLLYTKAQAFAALTQGKRGVDDDVPDGRHRRTNSTMGDRDIKQKKITWRCAQKLQRQLCFPLSPYTIVFIIISS